MRNRPETFFKGTGKSMSLLPEFKHYRRQRESRLLPDSRVVWLLQVVGAVVLGCGIAALIVWWR